MKHGLVSYPNCDISRPAAGISATIIADSITDGGCRLTTWELTYPRKIHSEFLTHGMLRRNSASSRAIPAKTLRERVLAAPVIPVHWGQNQKGMQADAEVADTATAEKWWRDSLAVAAQSHRRGEELGLHKQIINRVIEPWMPITIIMSATDIANFFHQRNHKDAEPNMRVLARLMHELYHEYMPTYIAPGGWHIPFVDTSDIEVATSTEELLKISVGRCARVSYLTHNGVRDKVEDIALHDRLARTASEGIDPMHASPFEHQAQALHPRRYANAIQPVRIGPFEGWKQYRKMFEREAGPDTRDRCLACGIWGGNHVTKCPNNQKEI